MSADTGAGMVRTDPGLAARRLPPIGLLAVVSIGLVIVAGIYLTASLPRSAALGPAVGLLVAAAAVLVVDLVLVSRLRPFAWGTFFLVAGWALVAYLVIGGMLEFIFVFDHTRGSVLAVLTGSLVVFALDVPLLFGFSVARYQAPGG